MKFFYYFPFKKDKNRILEFKNYHYFLNFVYNGQYLISLNFKKSLNFSYSPFSK